MIPAQIMNLYGNVCTACVPKSSFSASRDSRIFFFMFKDKCSCMAGLTARVSENPSSFAILFADFRFSSKQTFRLIFAINYFVRTILFRLERVYASSYTNVPSIYCSSRNGFIKLAINFRRSWTRANREFSNTYVWGHFYLKENKWNTENAWFAESTNLKLQ